ADPLLLRIDAENLEGAGHAGGDLAGPAVRTSRRRKGRRVREHLDARLELDERAELRDAGDAAGPDLADRVGVVHPRPRIRGELLEAERDLPLRLVDVQHLDGDLVAGVDHL